MNNIIQFPVDNTVSLRSHIVCFDCDYSYTDLHSEDITECKNCGGYDIEVSDTNEDIPLFRCDRCSNREWLVFNDMILCPTCGLQAAFEKDIKLYEE